MSEELFNLEDIAPVTKPRKAADKSTYLFYSSPGIGKTTLGGSASEVEALSPVLLLDFENGSSTLERKYPDVDVIKISTWEMGMEVIEALVHNPTKYKTIVFDSLSESQLQIIAWSEKVDGDNGFAKWDAAWKKLTASVKGLHMTDYNVICITHIEKDVDEFTRQRVIRPAFQGKKSHTELPKVFDYIGMLFVQEDEAGEKRRVLQFEMDDNVVTKNRSSGVLPDFVTDPTMKKIHDYLSAE